MQVETLMLKGRKVRAYSYNTVVVGSGAAGLNAAGRLHQLGQKNIAVVTEGLRLGTSRNTGSDKQTYYRLTVSGPESDSVERMAETLFAGGCMDGDLAMCEGACSARSFFHLVELGVPFPHNRFGEYIGYKTDHDPCKRGTSAGPLTSKFMTECLLQDVQTREITIFDGFQVIELLTAPDGDGKKAVGFLALDRSKLDDPDGRYVLFHAVNIIYATGGEAGMYQTSVYPKSQMGGTGTALRAGVRGKNLTESQYGIASIKFRWNLSGTYQQVIPRYVSTDQEGGDEREFMDAYFDSSEKMLGAIFLKGYQWPFDPRKVADGGSSLIDLLVYNETVLKNRRVFMDFTRNPTGGQVNGKFDFSRIGQEALAYLETSGALQETPIARLAHMNQPAIALYRKQGIDLYTERLEIAVCAQHNNGGLVGNAWWESNIRHLFPIGEVNGTHGVYRPGGSALNAGQVGGLRACQYIVQNYAEQPQKTIQMCQDTLSQAQNAVEQGECWLSGSGTAADAAELHRVLGERMSRYGAHIRSLADVQQAESAARAQLEQLEKGSHARNSTDLAQIYRVRDLLVSQITYLGAIADYILQGGESRGSYLVTREDGQTPAPALPKAFTFRLDDGRFADRIQESVFEAGKCRYEWRAVRPIPEEDQWFENVWRDYLEKKIIC